MDMNIYFKFNENSCEMIFFKYVGENCKISLK